MFGDILKFNEWWKTNEVNKEFIPEYKRKLFFEILKYLKEKQIIGIVGARRTGKTTIFYQLIDYLIKNGVNPKNIVYFSFDENKMKINEIIKLYEENIKRGKGKVYLFFDEIQKLENWQNQLKLLYDLNPKFKIFVSGSESINLISSKETLAGRIFYLKLDLLSFEEFLSIRKKEKYLEEIKLWEKEIKKELKKYFLRPFPEIVNKDESFCKKYIKESVIERVIFKDIMSFGIKELDKVESLIKIIGSNPGMIIDLRELSSELRMSRQSLSNYLYYLELSFIVNSIKNYRGSFRSSSRKLKKYYLLHPSFNISLGYENESKNVENMVLFKTKSKNYWREGKYEVDFVKNKMPIEVKYRNQINKSYFKPLFVFMEKFKAKKGIMITKDVENKGKISLIPFWKFMVEADN